ncbi:MAG TPA: arylsulfatase [Pirellulales bacterium]|jgi:arylsulfatase A-like enzyme|nr:arylsulfatase [Pirellulales bacterium]
MNWRILLLPFALLVVAGPALRAAGPNVVLVLVDDAGYGDLSCHGNPILKTPHIDQLYAESIRLTDFHVGPMCTATRGQLLTGVDALRNGAMNVSSGRTLLRGGLPTLANLFAAAGYRTGQFGKWHLGDNYPYRPQDRGFQQSMWFPSSHIPSAPDYFHNSYFDTWLRRETGQIRQSKGYCTDVYFDAAMHFIADRKAAGEPFFVYLPLNAAHSPLLVPEKYRQQYAGQPEPVARFFGMIANIDDNMGRLNAMLDQQGLRDNTIVIYMTDNGGTVGVPVFNAGMRGHKMELYDGGHRVPCFVRWPGGKLGGARDIDELTGVQDLLPTLAELCGLKIPSGTHLDGTSLAGLFRSAQASLPDRMLVVQYSRVNSPKPAKGDAAVLLHKWRLVRDSELYDIATDPAQAHDVAAQHADVVKQMREHYDRWWSEIEPTVNDLSAITVGSDAENPTMLSPADWADVFLDQSAQVREGVHTNGPWNVLVDRAGDYEIRLRRWPDESGLALDANDPATVLLQDVEPTVSGKAGVMVAGKALPIARARLKVGDQEQVLDVQPADQAATFNLSLPAGRTQLQTWFYGPKGGELCGAYYVYVRRK